MTDFDMGTSEQDLENYRILNEEVASLKNYLEILKNVISSNSLEIPSIIPLSDIESICISEISKLKLLSDKSGLSLEDVKILEILHKNLLLAKGKAVPQEEKKKTKHNVGELLSIVKGGK